MTATRSAFRQKPRFFGGLKFFFWLSVYLALNRVLYSGLRVSGVVFWAPGAPDPSRYEIQPAKMAPAQLLQGSPCGDTNAPAWLTCRSSAVDGALDQVSCTAMVTMHSGTSNIGISENLPKRRMQAPQQASGRQGQPGC